MSRPAIKRTPEDMAIIKRTMSLETRSHERRYGTRDIKIHRQFERGFFDGGHRNDFGWRDYVANAEE